MNSMANHRVSRILLLCAVIFCLTTAAEANPWTRIFLDGVRFYEEGDYEKSIAEFQKIADAGVRNGQLFYNLGNAYLRSDRLGHAILWYERALELMPDDPDLEFNHAHALSLTKDERVERASSLVRILFFWRYLLSPTAVRWIALGLNLLFWSAVLIRMVRRKRIWKVPVYLLFLVTLIFTGTAGFHYYEDAFIREAVILSERVPVRSGFTEGATELFVLHAGTKIRVEMEKDDFFRIFFAEGKIGWIHKTDVGII